MNSKASAFSTMLVVFSLFLAASVATAQTLSPSVQHVKRSALPAGWSRPNVDMDTLEELLNDVSHPDSPNYGNHWSPARVAAHFAASDESVHAVLSWICDSGIARDRVRVSKTKGWVLLNATVAEAESILDTEYHVFEHGSGAEHIACDGYNLPVHVIPYVEIVTPTIDFNAILKRSSSTFSTRIQVGQPGAGTINPVTTGTISTVFHGLKNCDQQISPDCIRTLYNFVYPEPLAASKNSLAIVEYDTPQAYRPADLDMFAKNFTSDLVGARPVLQSIDGGTVQNINTSLNLNGESNLDLEYAMTLVTAKQPVTLYQAGDLEMGASFNNLLDALDASYCTFEGGDDSAQDGIYPDTLPGGYQGDDCGTVTPAHVISTSYASGKQNVSGAYGSIWQRLAHVARMAATPTRRATCSNLLEKMTFVRCKSPRGLDIAKTKTRSQADGLSNGSALTQDLLIPRKAASRPQIQGLGVGLCHPPDFLAITLPGVYLVLWRVLSQNLQRARLLQVFDITVHVRSQVTSSEFVQPDNDMKGRESVECKKMNGRSSGVCLSLPFVLPLTWDVFFWVPSLRYTVARPLRNRMVCVVPESSTCSVLLRYPLFGKPGAIIEYWQTCGARTYYGVRHISQTRFVLLMWVQRGRPFAILHCPPVRGVCQGHGDLCLNPDGSQTANGTIFNPTFPSTCPFITATQINPGASVFDAESACEQVIFSGGGFSNYFAIPGYQQGVVETYMKANPSPYPTGTFNTSGTSRVYPDIAANGANYVIAIDGEFVLGYGTSASTPVVASMLTIFNDARLALGKSTVGFINPTIYSPAFRGAFNDITNGTNQGCGTDGFFAVEGYDPVTGLGTPNFAKLLALWTSGP
ncbi:Pro-kumamolisin, activation domain-containing protein [Mycena galopus ATCC 62051]|nr:Pro-kumamolisin, activation domain-containing protein [Mycena galopus ATCC 62051]